MSLQWQVFKVESDKEDPMTVIGGSNKELGYRPPEDFVDMHDFIEDKR